MKRIASKAIIVSMIMVMVGLPVFAAGPDYGAAAATKAIQSGAVLTIPDMLRWAVEDEYLAHGEYLAIIRKFGSQRPYSNIVLAEEQHLGWLKTEFANRSMAFPADGSSPHVIVPADLKAAAQAGVDAEISNIAMYKAFLARPELARPENASVKTLFEHLMAASENHLRSFRTQLAKY